MMLMTWAVFGFRHCLLLAARPASVFKGCEDAILSFLSDGLPCSGSRRRAGSSANSPDGLGQVEVIKGVSSALYGAGAMAVVLNLIARRPSSEPIHDCF